MEANDSASRAERACLVDAALSSLRSLSTHLTYTLTGMRTGHERPLPLELRFALPLPRLAPVDDR